MRRSSIAILLVLFLSGAVFAGGENTAPDWSLAAADGETIRLSEQVGEQPVILFFWATWCPYCKALMPHLQSMRLEYGDDVRILAINIRDKGDPVGFVRDAGYDFTILPNGDNIAEIYNVYGTPGVIVVDREQLIRFDLRALPPAQLPPEKVTGTNRVKAAYLAPYWAAEIRKSIDSVLE